MFVPHSRRRAAAAVAIGLLLAGCADNAPQDLFEPAGPNARKIDEDLGGQRFIFIVAGIVAALVIAAVLYIVVKFKDRGQELPDQGHGKPVLELVMTIGPALLLAAVAVPTWIKVMELNESSDAECVVNVTGQQWWWEYDYPAQTCGGITIPEPIVTSGEMVIPAGVPVQLRITSRDVIHSYWIPALNGKRDAVPGRLHPLRMEADEPGIYVGQCTEFCGLSHARMRQAVVALDGADFQTWVDNQLEEYVAPEEGSLAAEGEAQFITNCSYCHQVNGLLNSEGGPVLARPDQNLVSGAAPNLTNLMTRTGFAGFTFDLVTEECRDKLWDADPAEFGEMYLAGVWMNTPEGATTPACFNEVELRSWLRNAPAMKPMYTDPNKLEASDGLMRGMPDLPLSEEQIDLLISYLLERK